MRTFIAIELTEIAHKELAGLQAVLKKSNADVKWTEPGLIHLTLKFLGDTDPQKINEVERIINEMAQNTSPFTLTLKGIGAFSDLDYPRVIWAGIKDGTVESRQLARLLEEKLEMIGFSRENRNFHPHLTLGRVKSPKNKDKLKQLIEAEIFEPKSVIEVKHLTLFESRLTSEGPVYIPLFIARMKNA